MERTAATTIPTRKHDEYSRVTIKFLTNLELANFTIALHFLATRGMDARWVVEESLLPCQFQCRQREYLTYLVPYRSYY